MKRPRGTVVPCRSLLLTGGTGVLGANVLKELLRDTDVPIACLVRADSRDAGIARLHSFLRIYDPHGMLDDAFLRRVRVLLGDVGEDRLGLSEEDYETLVATTDVTIHVAANTNLFLNYRRIAPINVGGTRRVIDFALRTATRRLCHVSSHTVVGEKILNRDTVFRETDLDIGQTFPNMSYQQTKFEAEKMVHAAAAEGLRWSIFRPGNIFGEAKSGLYPHKQGTVSSLFYDMLKTVMESGVAQDSEFHFDVVPVDYVSRAIVHLSLRRDVPFETYHLTNPDIKSYRDVMGLLERLGFSVEWLEQKEFERRLNQKQVLRFGREYKSPTTSAFRWWFKRGILFTESGVTDCTITRRILEADGIHCPPIDERLIGTYFRAGTESGYFGSETPFSTPDIGVAAETNSETEAGA